MVYCTVVNLNEGVICFIYNFITLTSHQLPTITNLKNYAGEVQFVLGYNKFYGTGVLEDSLPTLLLVMVLGSLSPRASQVMSGLLAVHH